MSDLTQHPNFGRWVEYGIEKLQQYLREESK